VSVLILVVDDEPDVEVLFSQQFPRDLRAGRFTMEPRGDSAVAMDSLICPYLPPHSGLGLVRQASPRTRLCASTLDLWILATLRDFRPRFAFVTA
jgi:hypothetical protein